MTRRQQAPASSRRRRTRRIGPLQAVASLAVATSLVAPGSIWPASATEQADAAPALHFTTSEHAFLPLASIWRNNHPYLLNTATGEVPDGHEYFSELQVAARDGGAVNVTYAIEDSYERPENQVCYAPNYLPVEATECHHAEVGAGPIFGELYVYLDKPYEADSNGNQIKKFNIVYSINEFEPQRIQASAADNESALKIYEDMIVDSPRAAPDCKDFPGFTVDSFVCHHLYEILPEPPATTDALRNGLPDLVKPAAQYDLVLAEEFNGVAEDREGCDNGFETIDRGVWTVQKDACFFVDSAGTPCGNVQDGSIYVAGGTGCTSSFATFGKVHYKYGYIEMKYKITRLRNINHYINTGMIIGDPRRSLLGLHERYGITLDSYEDLSKYTQLEVNMLEFIPWYARETSHQYFNESAVVLDRDTRPLRTNKDIRFCNAPQGGGLSFRSVGCGNGPITVTRGLEWTPRGYRLFIKVEGEHDSLVRFDKSSIEIQRREAKDNGNKEDFFESMEHVSSAERSDYFEDLVPGDASSFMEQVGIAHIPLPMQFYYWGFSLPPTIDAKMEVDYVRIFQPRDKYADMEPVYQ